MSSASTVRILLPLMAQANMSTALKPIEDVKPGFVVFDDATHNKQLLAVFSSLREQEELCDVTIAIGSARIAAHRLILAGSSPYFRAMFTNGLLETHQNEVTLQDMDEAVFGQIVDYFYSGRLYINENNVQDLLSISGLLQLKRLQEACCEFMKRQINTHNCLGIAALADAHSCQDLASSADSYAKNHFAEVVQSDEFMIISQSQLLRLIADDGLNVHSEERVFEAVLAWVKYDAPSREEYVAEIFQYVRFPQLSVDFLLDRVASEDIMRKNKSCYNLLIEAVKLLVTNQSRAPNLSPREMPRKPAAVQQILYAVGGMSRREKLKSGERYDPKEGKWKPIGDMNVRRWGADVAAMGAYLYICGGSDDQSRLNTVEKYDPSNNVWIPVPAMTTNRNGVGVASGHGRIYAVGGFDGSRPLQTAEYFDPKVCKWTEMPKMNQCRFGVGCCVLNDNIYAVGGSDGTALKTAERFDHATNQWTQIASMNYTRKHVVCVALGNYIYAIGGNDQGIKSTTVERYDPYHDQWIEMASLLTVRNGCGVGVLDGYIYVVGGYDGTTCLKTAERYDPLSNRWYPIAPMTHAREYVAVCVASSKRTVSKRALDNARSSSPPVIGKAQEQKKGVGYCYGWQTILGLQKDATFQASAKAEGPQREKLSILKMHLARVCSILGCIILVTNADIDAKSNGVVSNDLEESLTKKELSTKGQQEEHERVLKKLGEHGTPIEGELTELDYSISGTDFYTHFIRKRKPIVFRGVAKRWMAVKYWQDDNYMKEKYGHVIVDVEMGKIYKNALNPRQTMNISHFIDIYKDQTIYLDSPFPQSELMNDLEVPFFMQCPELSPNFTSAHLLFSSGNTSSCFHHDGYENLLTMVSGIKVITLVNYTYMKEVYADHIDAFPGLSPISPEGVDFEKWPLFKDVPFHKIVLKPGDIVYIPKNWWHHVRSFNSPNIAVTIWFNMFENKTEPGDDEEVIGIRDVIKQEMQFAKMVESAPETIECVTQNIPISKVLKQEDTLEMPDEESLILEKTLNNGYKIPMIGFGTAGLFEKTEELVQVALNEGYRLIDSAQGYNESGVGNGIQKSDVNRSNIFIVSKVHPKNLGYDSTVLSIKESLANLKTDYIDLMLIHSKDCDEGPNALLVCGEGEPKGNWTESWKALEFMVEKGKIHSIGVSNFELEDLELLKDISKIKLSAIQNWFDPFNRDDAIREWCRKNDVAYMGYSTLGESWVREGYGLNPVLSDQELNKISRRYDADVPRVVLRWAVDNDVIVIPRSSDLVHIATNLNIEKMNLLPSEIGYINSLNNKLSEGDSAKTKPQGNAKEFVYNNVIYEDVVMNRPTIFVSSDDHWIYAFDAETGSVKWKTETADETGSSCAFSLDEEIVYCGADDTYIRALHAKNGSLVWHFKTLAPVTSSSHVTRDGTLLIGSHDAFLYALHPNGTLRWKYKVSGPVWSSPVTNKKGNIVFIAAYVEEGKTIFAIDVKTGKLVWDFEGLGGFISSPVLSPDESLVVFCGGYGDVYALDSWTGELLWQAVLDGPIESTPVFAKNSKLFLATYYGELASLDARNGKVLWRKQVSENITSSTTLGPNGQIFIGGGDGNVLALEQRSGEKIWNQKIGNAIFFSSPRLAKNGLVYIGSADTPGSLFALNAEDGGLMWKTDTQGPLVGTPLISKRFAAKYD
eukprot:gene7782-8627_t